MTIVDANYTLSVLDSALKTLVKIWVASIKKYILFKFLFFVCLFFYLLRFHVWRNWDNSSILWVARFKKITSLTTQNKQILFLILTYIYILLVF